MKRKGSKKKQRIGHANPGPKLVVPAGMRGQDDLEDAPRGWIDPKGRFISTNHHWEAISGQLGARASSDPEIGERNAHVAYSRGWISLGHGGALNAIGHASTFSEGGHPAVQTLRKLVEKIPHFSFRVEKQIGKLDSATGRHEDFEVMEYDLVYFVKRGRLRKA